MWVLALENVRPQQLVGVLADGEEEQPEEGGQQKKRRISKEGQGSKIHILGCIWLYIGIYNRIYGYIWPYMAMYGHI